VLNSWFLPAGMEEAISSPLQKEIKRELFESAIFFLETGRPEYFRRSQPKVLLTFVKMYCHKSKMYIKIIRM
jgi:hypothetical protein